MYTISMEETDIRTGPIEAGSMKLGVTPGGGVAAGVWERDRDMLDTVEQVLSLGYSHTI